MPQHRSINRAISQLLVGAVLLVTLIYSLLILLYSWVIEDNIFNRQVRDEALYIQQIYATTGTVAQPRAAYMSLHPNWQGLPQKFKQQQQLKPDKIEFELDNGGTLHVQIFKLGGHVQVLAADVAAFEVSRDYLPRTIVWLGLISVLFCLVVALIALYRAKQITEPLNRLAEQVASNKSIESIEIAGQYPNNEIGLLAQRIKDTFARLTKAWAREANFTKDVSHEIRTPVTVAKNILQKPVAQVSSSEWQQLKEANLRLEQTTETLLALARNESTTTETTNLTALLEHCLLTNKDVNHTHKGQAIEFELDTPEDIWREVNKNLVEILFNNILSNIVHYQSGNKVAIQLTESKIQFSNSYQQPLPDEPLKSGARGMQSQGIGHGLSLIKRIAEVYSWQVEIETSGQTFNLNILI